MSVEVWDPISHSWSNDFAKSSHRGTNLRPTNTSPKPSSFPGTFSTQPAVTTQTFGHKYGGFIYAFLFSSDIINNLLVATMSRVGGHHFILYTFYIFVTDLLNIFIPHRPNRPNVAASPPQLFVVFNIGTHV